MSSADCGISSLLLRAWTRRCIMWIWIDRVCHIYRIFHSPHLMHSTGNFCVKYICSHKVEKISFFLRLEISISRNRISLSILYALGKRGIIVTSLKTSWGEMTRGMTGFLYYRILNANRQTKWHLRCSRYVGELGQKMALHIMPCTRQKHIIFYAQVIWFQAAVSSCVIWNN